MSEVDMAANVIMWLHEYDWEVFQEVRLDRGGRRADIIARRGPLIRAIECKLSLSATVIEQAIWWRHSCHYSHVATMHRRHTKGRWVMKDALRRHRIGLITVDKKGQVSEDIPAPLNRKACSHNWTNLHGGFKTSGKAGNANNEYYSPWRNTCRLWTRYVERNPGCSLQDLIDDSEHHYNRDSTAKSAMLAWIHKNKVPGIRVERDGRRLRFYPTDQKKPPTGKEG